jgi:DNA-binding MltR family transcriptional regulator
MPWISQSTTDVNDIRQTLRELEHTSDRAAGIVGAVLVDESLTALLKSRLAPDENLLNELFRSSGPLGPFSVKINLGFLMGLYSKDAWKELDTIKNIRNQFAHYAPRSFAYQSINDLANNLSLSERVDFHIASNVPEGIAIWLGSRPPADRPSVPLLPVITPDQLVPKERYLRACQFFSAALLVLAQFFPRQPLTSLF